MRIDKTIAVALISLLLVCGAALGTSVGYVRADNESDGDNGSSGNSGGDSGGGSSDKGGRSGSDSGSGSKGQNEQPKTNPGEGGSDNSNEEGTGETTPTPVTDPGSEPAVLQPTVEPIAPVIPEPIKEKKPLPYCDTPAGKAAPSCHDRYDFDDKTGLYPCNDGTQKKDPKDCKDAFHPCGTHGFHFVHGKCIKNIVINVHTHNHGSGNSNSNTHSEISDNCYSQIKIAWIGKIQRGTNQAVDSIIDKCMGLAS